MTKKRSSIRWVPLYMIVTLLLCVGGFVFQSPCADAVTGCCAHHKGVCECRCCDGTPLSERCRSRKPECDGRKRRISSTRSQGKEAVFRGTVEQVIDGDTIRVREQGEAHMRTIRVADIDCPENAQPYGPAATELTQSLTLHRAVVVHVHAVDSYHRNVADVFFEEKRSLAAALLRAGLAWWYRDYSTDQTLKALEEESRQQNRGLWSQADPLAPWVFRRQQREQGKKSDYSRSSISQ